MSWSDTRTEKLYEKRWEDLQSQRRSFKKINITIDFILRTSGITPDSVLQRIWRLGFAMDKPDHAPQIRACWQKKLLQKQSLLNKLHLAISICLAHGMMGGQITVTFEVHSLEKLIG